RWRLPPLRYLAGVAGVAGATGVGLLSERGCAHRQDRFPHTALEVALLGVDEALRGLAVLRRVALRRLRLQRGAVLPELRRGARGAVGRAGQAAPVGPARPPAVGRSASVARARAGGAAARGGGRGRPWVRRA